MENRCVGSQALATRVSFHTGSMRTDAERDTVRVAVQLLTGAPALSSLLLVAQRAASVSFYVCSSQFSPDKLLHWLPVA